jgi:hypothetical protein
VVSLKLGYLTFCFLTSNSVAFLDLSNELIALSFDDVPVSVGQASPRLLGLSDELSSVSFDLISIHPEPPAKSNRAFKTARKGRGFPPLPASRLR